MTKKKSKEEAVNSFDDFETLQLKTRITELEKKLKDAEMKAIAYSIMVEVAE